MDEGNDGGDSTEYVTIPVNMFVLRRDLKAVLMSSFSCRSPYSAQHHLQELRMLCGHI